MTNKKMSVLFLIIILFFGIVPASVESAGDVWDGAATDIQWSGSGTEADPYLITSAAEFAGLANQVKSVSEYSGTYFRLEIDIDLANKDWMPIGCYTSNGNMRYFRGVFDGNGKVIKNLSFTTSKDSTDERQGLFGSISSASIRNLGVENVTGYMHAWTYNGNTGGLAGYAAGTTTVDSCYVKNITVTVATTNAFSIGGLIGGFSGTSVTNCYAYNVNVSCSAGMKVAGLLGSSSGTVANCYAAKVAVSSTSSPAAFAGSSTGTVTSCYYTDSNKTDAYAVAKTVEEMKASAALLGAEFQEDVYGVNNGYPLLLWQNLIPEGYFKASVENADGGSIVLESVNIKNGYVPAGETVKVIITVNPDTIIGKVTYNGTAIIAVNGEYSFVMPECDVAVTVQYVSDEQINTIINRVNIAKQQNNSDEIKSIFESETVVIDAIAGNLFRTLSGTYSSFMPEFYNVMSVENEVGSPEAFITQIEMASLTVIINHETDTARIDEWLDMDPILTGTGAYQTYCEILSDSEKENICGLIEQGSFGKIADLRDFYAKHVILQAISSAKGWGTVKYILQMNAEVLEIDFTECNKLKSPENAYGMLQESEFETLGAIKSAFEIAVEEVAAQEEKAKADDSDTPASPAITKKIRVYSGGGGSKSSASAPAVIVPTTAPVPTPTPAADRFTDLGSVPWAKESIAFFAEKGYIKGKDGDKFMPDEEIVREEFVKLLILSANLYNENAEADFDDVSKGEWYYPYIASAVKNGIVTGESSSCFGIGEKITREDMAAMAYRAVVKSGAAINRNEEAIDFADEADISDYAEKPVRLMQCNHIINGMENGKFMPKAFSTRAQASVVAYRLAKLILN